MAHAQPYNWIDRQCKKRDKKLENIQFHTNLKFCPQCEKEEPYVNNYVTGSIRCAKCSYFHLKQYE